MNSSGRPAVCDYRPPPLFGNAHLQTIFPTLFRRVGGIIYRRERLELADGDFLDLDWFETGHPRLALICHGLESSSRAAYVQGMARACSRAGWDVVAINQRGCSGAPNRLLRSYHSGATEDLDAVVRHCEKIRPHHEQALIGFSLGGNLVLKCVGEWGGRLPGRVARVIAVSTPCDLESGALKLEESTNRIYQWRFVAGLKRKIRMKCRRFPERLRWEDFRAITTVREFDERYTAPVHGFRNARDYWRRCSCRPLIAAITVPTLILSAADDPFLAPGCYPWKEAQGNARVRLRVPDKGGHVGFVGFAADGLYWHERVAVEFLDEGHWPPC